MTRRTSYSILLAVLTVTLLIVAGMNDPYDFDAQEYYEVPEPDPFRRTFTSEGNLYVWGDVDSMSVIPPWGSVDSLVTDDLKMFMEDK